MKHLHVFLLVFITFSTIYSQNGPAGIGSKDGTSELILWLDANEIIGLSEGQAVTTWLDLSGLGNDVAQSNASYKPVYNENVLNSLPVVTFDGTDDVLERVYDSDLNTDAFALFCVTRTTGGDGNYRAPFSVRYNAGANNLNGFCLFARDNNTWSYWWGDASFASWRAINGSSGIANWTSLCAMHDQTKGYFYEDGDGAPDEFAYSKNTVNRLTIGSTFYYSSSSYDHHYYGQIAEVILFDKALTLGERTLVDNYVAAKFGMSTSADRYSGDTDGDYDFNVAGIMSENSTSLTNANSAGLIITDVDYLDADTDSDGTPDGDYFMVGHKVIENSIIAVSATNANYRWERAWYISKTNGEGAVNGDIDIIFDFGDTDLSETPSGTFYLLKSSDDEVSWTEVTTSSTIQNTDQVLFSSINTSNFNSGDIITIGHEAVAMPVELVEFSCTIVENNIQLNWETATEVNNYGFQVQNKKTKDKSEDNWADVGFVPGHGTANSPKSYSFTDPLDLTHNPNLNRIDYRLKQIDNNGTYNYSKTISVDLTNITDVDYEEVPTEYSLSQNYPNPFNPTTSIKFGFPENGFVDLRVFNMLGQEVAQLVSKEMRAGYHEVNFDASSLSSGMYFYKINVRNEFSSSKKMIFLK